MLPGPTKSDCICGCGLFGVARTNRVGHVRRCGCQRCENGRYGKRAAKRERVVAKAVHGRRNPMSGALGGNDVIEGVVDVEETAKVSVVRGARRWWESKTVRDKFGPLYDRQLLPRAVVLSWDEQPRLVLMTWNDFAWLLEEGQGSDVL